MADQVQLRGGTSVQHAAFTGALREVTVDTDKKVAVVHDGATVGGIPMLRQDMGNLSLTGGQATTARGTLGAVSLAGDTMTGLLKLAAGANIASAATVNLSTATGNTVHVTGTTAITAWTMTSGQIMDVIFDGILTLTHHTTTCNIPGGLNITTAANDRARLYYDGTTVYVMNYLRASGAGVDRGMTLLHASTNSNVATIDIASVITSAFDEYIVEIYDVLPRTAAAALYLRLSTDNGASFVATGYINGRMLAVASAVTALNSTGDVAALISGAMNTAVGSAFRINVKVQNSATGVRAFVHWTGGYYSSSGDAAPTIGCCTIATDTFNALRFLMSSGNIDAKVRVYGLRNA